MSDNPEQDDPSDAMGAIMRAQAEALSGFFGLLGGEQGGEDDADSGPVQWGALAQEMQAVLARHLGQQEDQSTDAKHFSDPAQWLATAQAVLGQLPLADPSAQMQLWQEGAAIAQAVLGQFGVSEPGEKSGEGEPQLPLSDPRFSDPKWRQSPFHALVHQLYLFLSQSLTEMAQGADGVEPARRAQLVFATQMLCDALSPANFPLTNPVALERAKQTGGKSLVEGFEHLLSDIGRGQLTQTAPDNFVLGQNIADTPGKVVHETPLFQLIQYTPTTRKVLETPLVIFPPWINRFYILDLNAKKSFVRWVLDQGVSVFMVSWKSADALLADIVWDDYIAAQIEAIDVVCKRLKVPTVHTIGYCVAGTTLAATLAVMARKGEAGKVATATFFTAQVDFAEPGDLGHFIDEAAFGAIDGLATDGYLDGRYMAATFNLLRPNDLIWPYVQRNYLEGRGYAAFDLLYWNSDYTNLPAQWHREYLRDLYRDNRLVEPDSLSACGEPIDLRRIEVPCYIQAGREDHIAPAASVWKLTRQLSGDWTFVLAGSGHIAGVVNPPAAGKYQYWTNEDRVETLDEFIDGASEHPGSWWPHWIAWLKGQSDAAVVVKGKRKPGIRGDAVIEDAPGRYVAMR